MSRQKIFCRYKISPSAIELCLSFVTTFSCWLRHISFGLLEFCIATYKNFVATQTAAFSTFLLLFSLFSLFFQLTPAKQKVGEYSIIGYTNRSKIVKNMLENGLKIDDFKTHQIPPNLMSCLSPRKEKKFCLSSNNSGFYF